ncbi:MAG: aminotransferase class V-fold PLP-dependent enzyme [Candidatus Sumerlaeaceae bacterium]|nr:aminotransferase class V-fold PLP-dependent enzyme [Candidatus Sumerlaeaceae bacterium]
MTSRKPLTFKIATEPDEFEQIHRLNYRTFVEEIPQHRPNEEGRLVDRFHDENTYLICLCEKRVVGMLAVRDRRPFSLDLKLPNLDDYLPPAKSMCEIRLLAVEPEFRTGRVFRGLALELARYGLRKGYDLALISGTTRQINLYRHLGFIPFGPLVGTSGAQFQPMYMTKQEFEKITMQVLGPEEIFQAAEDFNGHVANFLPGPVNIHPDVQAAFSRAPVSHRGEEFMREFQGVKRQLCRLANAQHVEIFVGSGTLANDVVGAQLKLLNKPGLVLANGEFGWRLADAASRFGLAFEVYEAPYGQPFDYEALRARLDRSHGLGWVWGVHCETSTGILNNLPLLAQLCNERSIRLAMDCISSFGIVPLDMSGLYLASAVSGKGLSSLPGLSMVFYNHKVSPATTLPRYLDLGYYASKHGVPFTHSSNLIRALKAALDRFEANPPFAQRAEISAWARARLRDAGLEVLAPEQHAAPAVITLVLPRTLSSYKVGRELEEAGFLLSYMSEYLLERNWIQICFMGECSRESLDELLTIIEQRCSPEMTRETLVRAGQDF